MRRSQIAGAGHDKLAHAGKGSSIDRGDCERLFQLLAAEQVLGERYERNGLGFTNAYVTLGPRAQQLISGKLTLQMGFTEGGKSGGGGGKKGKAPAKQKTIDESYDHAQYGGEFVDEFYDERTGVYDEVEEEWCARADFCPCLPPLTRLAVAGTTSGVASSARRRLVRSTAPARPARRTRRRSSFASFSTSATRCVASAHPLAILC